MARAIHRYGRDAALRVTASFCSAARLLKVPCASNEVPTPAIAGVRTYSTCALSLDKPDSLARQPVPVSLPWRGHLPGSMQRGVRLGHRSTRSAGSSLLWRPRAKYRPLSTYLSHCAVKWLFIYLRWNVLECARVTHKLGTNSAREKFREGQVAEKNGGLGRD